MISKTNQAYILVIFLIIIACATRSKVEGIEASNCCVEADKNYDRFGILEELKTVLDSLAPDYKGVNEKGFYINEHCQLIGAFIFDLTDTLNKATTLNDCIKFLEGHVYHFAPMRKNYSYSSILFLKNKKAKIFKSVNCPSRGDQMADVLEYLNGLNDIPDKELVTERLKNYRKYSAFIQIDNQGEFNCN